MGQAALYIHPRSGAAFTPAFDFTNTERDINQYRFCSHIPLDDQGCNKCIDYCPSGAQVSSAPKTDGKYQEQVSRQAHRFWEGKLQFDFGKCTDERGQMSGLFAEWSCGRCLTVCADQGTRRKQAVQSFYNKMSELTRQTEQMPAPD
jgi:ferredoxin